MKQFTWLLYFGLFMLGSTADASKILALFTFPGKSHFGAYQPLLEELARRGHEVTVYTVFPKNKNILNYKEIKLEDSLPPKDSPNMNFFQMRKLSLPLRMFIMTRLFIAGCEKVLSQPNVQNLIHATDLTYDLIIYEPFFTQCTYGFLHKFKAPSIQVIPNTLVPWNPTGNPNTMSFVPSIIGENEDTDFLSRISTFLTENYLKLFIRFFVEPEMDAVMRKHFPDPSIPHISELERNASFLFLHSHPVLNHPRPLTPNTIEVGGLHVKPGNDVPKDLKKFLDDAPHGVVYFSMGSNVRSIDMPDEMRNGILKAFSKLKQKVLWKWETDSLPGQPSNVRIEKWLPQHDILAHPNVKLFITHGGLMSLQEATYFGVPLITIPVAADQRFNANVAKNRGFAVFLDHENITELSMDWALHEALHGARYREAAQRISKIFRDQPQTAMERAVFWIEYAIRHKGAAHLRSAAVDLNVFQYYLLDVIAVLLLSALLSLFLLVLIGRMIMKCVCSKSVSNFKKTSDKKKKN